MGGVRKAFICTHCPWSVAYSEPLAIGYLSAYSLLERWGERPPGKSDPRYFEAMTVIAAEHNRILDEAVRK